MVLLTWTMSHLMPASPFHYIGYESKQFTANELFSTEGICKKILETFKEELNQVLINVSNTWITEIHRRARF
jgi:hypothetical protein